MKSINRNNQPRKFAAAVKKVESKCATIRRTAKKFPRIKASELESILSGPGIRFNRNTVRTQVSIARAR